MVKSLVRVALPTRTRIKYLCFTVKTFEYLFPYHCQLYLNVSYLCLLYTVVSQTDYVLPPANIRVEICIKKNKKVRKRTIRPIENIAYYPLIGFTNIGTIVCPFPVICRVSTSVYTNSRAKHLFCMYSLRKYKIYGSWTIFGTGTIYGTG